MFTAQRSLCHSLQDLTLIAEIKSYLLSNIF